ncbi:hypothetical protein BDV39DRAFT_203091 [Aspergillus sergii]|uniref:Ankyrin repeat-containing domain protein n=1 Tax=Aspergillus sergii TaxID=1034303 RepID=A0A5N6XBH9_9EURO|nr:hypothetical protein BDV39DRAFT_203091 [Aspergillus sergii]
MDFLLESNLPDILFEPGSPKPKGNGHSYVLVFARTWLKLSPNQRKQRGCQAFDVVKEVIFHAHQLEATLSKTDAAYYFGLLDEIDGELTLQSTLKECWPTDEIPWRDDPTTWGDDISMWHFTFSACAVSMGMQGYVQHLIKKADEIGDREYFLNRETGPSLLHIAVYRHNPAMIELLLREGAYVNARFDEKSLTENLMFYQNTIQVCFNIIKIFLSNGANPNSRHYPIERRPKFWYPLLHLVVRMDDCIGIGPRIDLMRSLQRHGADLNATDYLGRSFLEVLYWKNRPFPKNEWYWLLKMDLRSRNQ